MHAKPFATSLSRIAATGRMRQPADASTYRQRWIPITDMRDHSRRNMVCWRSTVFRRIPRPTIL